MVTLATIALAAIALSPNDTLDTESLLVNLDESSEEIADLIDRLEDLRRRPIDLNRCSEDDLLELPFVSASEASAVMKHRRLYGRFASTHDLRDVKGLDAETSDRLLPFVSVHLPGAARRRTPLHADLTQRWTRRLERADGFRGDSSGYLGDPNVLQTRASISFGKLSGGATLDKDAGEPMDWDVRKRSLGYDFMAGHLQLKDVGWIRRLVLGDFSPRFAHGVLLRTAGGFRTAAPPGRGGAASLRPYASAGETGYFRGVGVQIEPAGWLGLTAFLSRRGLDAGIDATAGPENVAFSRRTSGLHRTVTERAGRGLLQESSFGGALQSNAGPISISTAMYVSNEALASSPTGDVLLRQRVSSYSLSAGATLGAVYVAAEIVPAAGFSAMIDVRSGTAGRFGLAIRRSRAEVYLPTSSLSGGSDGLTDGVTYVVAHGRHQVSSATNIDLSLEHQLLRAPRGHTPFPTVRSYADVVVRHTPMPWLTFTFRGTARRSDDASTCANGAVRCLMPTGRRGLRFQIDYRHSRRVESRVRGEYAQATIQDDASTSGAPPTSGVSPIFAAAPPSVAAAAPFSPTSRVSRTSRSYQGVLAYQELRIRAGDAVQVAGRLTVFSADQHAARIYAYENDLTYAFSSPSFSGRGRRAYVLARWRFTDTVTLESKWSQTVHDDVSTIGSGRDEIRGGRVREIRFQIRVRLR